MLQLFGAQQMYNAPSIVSFKDLLYNSFAILPNCTTFSAVFRTWGSLHQCKTVWSSLPCVFSVTSWWAFRHLYGLLFNVLYATPFLSLSSLSTLTDVPSVRHVSHHRYQNKNEMANREGIGMWTTLHNQLNYGQQVRTNIGWEVEQHSNEII